MSVQLSEPRGNASNLTSAALEAFDHCMADLGNGVRMGTKTRAPWPKHFCGSSRTTAIRHDKRPNVTTRQAQNDLPLHT